MKKIVVTGLAVFALGHASTAKAGGIFYTLKTPSSGSTFEIYSITATDGSPNTVSLSANPVATSSFTCGSTVNGCTSTARINGYSFDKNNNNFLFFNSNTSQATPTLYYAPVNGGTGSINAAVNSLTNASLLNGLNLTGSAFYKDAIFATANGSNTLYRIPVATSGGTVTLSGTITSYTLPVGGSGINYGDIAVANGVVYGFTTGATNAERIFYTYRLSDGAQSIYGNKTQQSMQISFGGNNTLYGVDSTGQWYTIDVANGGVSPYASSTLGFTVADLAGAEPVPSPLPVLGAAAAFQSSRRLRKRIKLNQSKV